MGIQVGGEIFSHNNTIKIPNADGTLATQEYVQQNAGGLPTQTGNSGKFLKTNGAVASWDTPAASLGYLVYTALLSQSGTDAPVATVLQNTLGGTIVWSYLSTGQYIGTLAGAFTANKTAIFITTGTFGAFAYRDGTDTIAVDVYNTSFVGEDGRLNADSLEIRIYP